jgi:hypothetical protein
MSAGSKAAMLNSRSKNPTRSDWLGGALIRCIVWLEACLLHLDRMTCSSAYWPGGGLLLFQMSRAICQPSPDFRW